MAELNETSTPAQVAAQTQTSTNAQTGDQSGTSTSGQTGQTGQTQAVETDWKAKSREWEKRAKDNKAAADELAQIKDAQKTEAEKAAEKLRDLEQARDKEAAKSARLELAIEHKLSKEDADLLEGVTDVEAMQRIAQRLATKAEENGRPRTPLPNPNQGNGTPGRATNAELFAASVATL